MRSLRLLSTTLLFLFVSVTHVEALDGVLTMQRDDLAQLKSQGWYEYGGKDDRYYQVVGYTPDLSKVGTITFPKAFPPGTYYLHLKCAEHAPVGTLGSINVTMGGVSLDVATDSRDINKEWTKIRIAPTSQFSSLQVRVKQAGLNNGVWSYTMSGLYLTQKADEDIRWDGTDIIVSYKKPTVMDDSPPTKGNIIPNNSFEGGIGYGWGIDENSTREVTVSESITSSSAKTGIRAMNIPLQYTQMRSRLFQLKANKKYTLSLWVKSPNGSGLAELVNANTFPSYLGLEPQSKLSIVVPRSSEWVRVFASGYMLNYPSSGYQITIKANELGMLVDDIQLEEGDLSDYAPAAEVEYGIESDKSDKMYTDAEDVRFSVPVYNFSSGIRDQVLQYELYDIANRKVLAAALALGPLLPQASSTKTLNFRALPKGVYRLISWIDGQRLSLSESLFTVTKARDLRALDPESNAGVHMAGLTYVAGMMKKAGISWTRSLSPGAYFRWEYVNQVEGGEYIWYDAQIDKLIANKQSIVANIGSVALSSDVSIHIPSWAQDPNTLLPKLDKWQTYVRNVVTHYKDKVKYWEIWNEPNQLQNSLPAFTPEYYAELLKVASSVIRSVDPSAKIIAMGGPYDPDWVLAVINALGPNPTQYFDIISMHFYPPKTDPWAGDVALRAASTKTKILDVYGAQSGIEVWNTESGNLDYGISKGESQNFIMTGEALTDIDEVDMLRRFYRGSLYEAETTVNSYVTTIGYGLSKFFFYDARNTVYPNYYEGKASFSLIDYDDSLKAKGVAYSAAIERIGKARGLGPLTGKAGVQGYLFSGPTRPLIAIGAVDDKEHEIMFSGLTVNAFDLVGNQVATATSKVQFGPQIVYIEPTSAIGADTLKSDFEAAIDTSKADAHAPHLSIDVFPTSLVRLGEPVKFIWTGIDSISSPLGGKASDLQYSYLLTTATMSGSTAATWSTYSTRNYIEFKSLVTGCYTLQVRARDLVGNVAQEQRAFYVSSSAGADPDCKRLRPQAPRGLTIH